MELDFFRLLELVGSLIVFPIIALVTWLAKGVYRRVDKLEAHMQDVEKAQAVTKRLFDRLETVEKEVVQIDKAQAVQEAQLTDIKQDIHQLSKKLDKIIDKLYE